MSRSTSSLAQGWMVRVHRDPASTQTSELYAVWESQSARACHLLARLLRIPNDQTIEALEPLSAERLSRLGCVPGRIASALERPGSIESADPVEMMLQPE